MWRILKIILGLYVLTNLIAAYIFWPRIDQFLWFMPRIEPASFSEPANTLEAQRQDLSYLETVLDYDRSFTPEAREVFQSRIAALKFNTKDMTEAEFYLTTRELMALADNGHTGVASGPAFRAFNRSGLDLYQFSDGYYVVRAQSARAKLIGKRIIAIEGQPIEAVIRSLRKYTGGPNNWRDLQSLHLLRSPQLLHAAGLSEKSDELRLTYLDDSNTPYQLHVKAMAPVYETDYFRHAYMTLSPEALGDEDMNWVRALNKDEDDIAPYLMDLSDVVVSHEVKGGLYIRSNYLMESRENPIKKMLLEPLKNAPSAGYDFIVVDLRWNPGGDFGNAVPFSRDAKSVLSDDGKIYVITGPSTFSAAIVFSALLKQSAPEKVLIVGEAMGDRPQFWSERGRAFTLPNSGYWINYATAYHDWEKGCAKTHEFCFPPNKKYNQDIEHLALDQLIELSYAKYAAGQDVVMEWIIEQSP